MTSFGALALLALTLLQTPPDPSGVRVQEVTVHPDTVRTGDTLRVRVALEVAHGLSITVPDTLPSFPGLVGRGSVERTGAGVLEYPLQALQSGSIPLPPLKLRVSSRGEGPGRREERWVSLSLGHLQVASVLPPPPRRVSPAPPRPPPPVPEPGPPWPLTLSFVGMALSGLLWRRVRGDEDHGPLEAPLSPAPGPGPGADSPSLHELLSRRPSTPAEARELLVRVLPRIRREAALTVGLETPGLTTPELLEALDGRSRGHGPEDGTAVPESGAKRPTLPSASGLLGEILREGEDACFRKEPPSPAWVHRWAVRVRRLREASRV